MPVDYQRIGERIKYFRNKRRHSQEKLAELVNLSRENLNRMENASKGMTIETLVNFANALHISADDLLVDSLDYSVSTADSDLHRLVLDCNQTEEQIITETAREMKKILYRLGI